MLCDTATGEGPPPEQCIPMTLAAGLRYGENPHQPAAFYTDRLAASGAGATQSDHCDISTLASAVAGYSKVEGRA